MLSQSLEQVSMEQGWYNQQQVEGCGQVRVC